MGCGRQYGAIGPRRQDEREASEGAIQVIWDRDPYSSPTAEIKDMTCLMTLLPARLFIVLLRGCRLMASKQHGAAV